MSKLLIDEYPLQILPSLAVKVGLNEAIVLQQLHYWINRAAGRKENYHDGRIWVYNSVVKWREQFPFWSEDTIQRTLVRLETKNLIFTGVYNKEKFDKTKWYSINYDALNNESIAANCSNQYCNLQQPIPETTTETITNIVTDYEEVTTPYLNTKERKKGRSLVSDFAERNEMLDAIETAESDKPTIAPQMERGTVNKKGKPVKPKRPSQNYQKIIDAHTSNPELKDAIWAYLQMRQNKRAAPTDYALQLALKHLREISSAEGYQIEVLNQSIINNWTDVYELKNKGGGEVIRNFGDVKL